jgi:hypothetical protein
MPPDPNRTFGPAVQINNNDFVVAVDRYSPGGTQWRLRTWNADGKTNANGTACRISLDRMDCPCRCGGAWPSREAVGLWCFHAAPEPWPGGTRVARKRESP